MKSITVHGLDDPLDRLIREKACQDGVSLNKTIKKLLAESLGLTSAEPTNHRNDFLDLFGVWSAEDKREFDNNIKDFSRIDTEDWL